MADFSTDVSAWCNRAEARGELLLRVISFDALSRVQDLTPVDTGFLRANWTAILLGDAEPVAGRTPPAGDALSRAKLGDTVLIINPVVYARRIEHGFVGEDSLGRHFNQPGRHMAEQTIAEMPQIAQRAYERVIAGTG